MVHYSAKGYAMITKNSVRGQLYNYKVGSCMPGEVKWNARGIISEVNWFSDAPEVRILPGFIDLHVHGASGDDVMSDHGTPLNTVSLALPQFGTTGFLATTITAPQAELLEVTSRVAEYCRQDSPGAKVLGMHLEGPYIDYEHRGAQPKQFIRPLNCRELRELIALNVIKIITLSPHTNEDFDMVSWLLRHNVRVNLGHTDIDFEGALKAFDAGVDGVTHLFNGMTGIHHRHPGPVMAAIADSRVWLELILDGVHVHPEVVKMLMRLASERIVAITDGTAAVGMSPGTYTLGSLVVYVDEHSVRLENGGLAGSRLTQDQALRNLLLWNVGLKNAVHALSEAPAQRLGLITQGFIKEGFEANFILMDEHWQVQQTWIRGMQVF